VVNSILILGLILFGIFLADLAERIETWLRRQREIHALYRRVYGWREGR
jgi:hypothetical protein